MISRCWCAKEQKLCCWSCRPHPIILNLVSVPGRVVHIHIQLSTLVESWYNICITSRTRPLYSTSFFNFSYIYLFLDQSWGIHKGYRHHNQLPVDHFYPRNSHIISAFSHYITQWVHSRLRNTEVTRRLSVGTYFNSLSGLYCTDGIGTLIY